MPLVAPVDLFTEALHILGVIGAAQSAPNAEDSEVCRRAWNRLAGQWATRRRFGSFVQEESFAFTTARTSYTIGKSTNSPAPNFSVASGNAPANILYAQLVMTNVTPNVQLQLAVINVDQWQEISIPDLSSQFPNTLYYVRPGSTLNGTLRPWPTSPTQTAFKMNLSWWNQTIPLLAADITTSVGLPDGCEEALTLTLAEKLWLMFAKRTDLEELKRQARIARADYQSPNVPPPKLDNVTGGASGRPSGFNWLTRLPG